MVDISSIGGLTASQNQQNLQKTNARLQALISTLASGAGFGREASDVAALSIAGQLQSEVSSLRQASANLAQGSSIAQVADSGIGEIQEVLGELKSLAQQAGNPSLGESARKALNQQFQELAGEIDRIVANTTFGGRKLLNGNISGDNAISLTALLSGNQGEDILEIASLSGDSLFSGKTPDLLSAGNASQALSVIGEALSRVAAARADVGAFRQAVGFAAAGIDSAAANQEAALSILQDADFSEASTGSPLLDIQRNLTLALNAQGNRLDPVLLQLIG